MFLKGNKWTEKSGAGWVNRDIVWSIYYKTNDHYKYHYTEAKVRWQQHCAPHCIIVFLNNWWKNKYNCYIMCCFWSHLRPYFQLLCCHSCNRSSNWGTVVPKLWNWNALFVFIFLKLYMICFSVLFCYDNFVLKSLFWRLSWRFFTSEWQRTSTIFKRERK